MIYDAASGARRQVTRTVGRPNPIRAGRSNDTAVTFVRDGNLFIMSLEAARQRRRAVRAVDRHRAAARAAARGRGAASARGGGGAVSAAAAPRRQADAAPAAATATQTDAQRLLAEQNRALIEFLKQSAGRARRWRRRAGRSRRRHRAAAPGAGAHADRASQPSTDRQNVRRSAVVARRKIRLGRRQRAAGRHGARPGRAELRHRVGLPRDDSRPHERRRRAEPATARHARRARRTSTVWADASAFAGVERKAKPADPDVPRILNWSRAGCVRRRRVQRGGRAVAGQQGPLVRDRRSGHRQSHRSSTGCTTTRGFGSRASAARRGGGLGGGAGIAWLPDNKRFLFLSEKDRLHARSIRSTCPRRRPRPRR